MTSELMAQWPSSMQTPGSAPKWDTHSASVAQARQDSTSQIGVVLPVPQWLSVTQRTHAPEPVSQAGACGSRVAHSPSLPHALQVLLAAQMGVLPEQSGDITHWTHAPPPALSHMACIESLCALQVSLLWQGPQVRLVAPHAGMPSGHCVSTA